MATRYRTLEELMHGTEEDRVFDNGTLEEKKELFVDMLFHFSVILDMMEDYLEGTPIGEQGLTWLYHIRKRCEELIKNKIPTTMIGLDDNNHVYSYELPPK